MDEIKPVAFAIFTSRKKPDVDWLADKVECGQKLYDQQSIDTLRAEVEENEAVIRVWRGRTLRAEAEADALRADAERYRAMRDEFTWSMFSDTERTDLTLYMPGVSLAAIGPNADDFDAAIDAAKQAAE